LEPAIAPRPYPRRLTGRQIFENRILKAQLKGQLKLSDAERATLGEIDTAFEIQQAEDFQGARCLVAAGGLALSQVHSRLRRPDVDHVQRGAMPAAFEGTPQGFAIHRHHAAQLQSIGLGKACNEPAEWGLERLWVQQAEDPAEGIVAGHPVLQLQDQPQQPSLDCPNVAMSEGPSAPHSVAARAMNKTSNNSCRALSALGSGNRRKALLNFSIRLHLCLGSRPQNPSCVNLQYPLQIHMRFPWVRNSSFTYKGRNIDVRQVGRELGVRYVLEGSVRRSSDRLRFTGQLIDATSGAHIWADRFEGQMSDVFDLQDRFTESVVAAIEPSVQLAEIGRLKHKPPDNLVVYDLFLRAQQLEYEFTEESLLAALHHLKQALAIDPNYAPALALSAYCYAERRNQGWAEDLETEATEGLRLVARATELGTDDSTVMWMAARAVWHLAHDAQRARELGNRSLHLNPNSAIALAITAWAEVHFGNAEKSIELCVRAERLNPRDPRGWMIATSLGIAYFAQRRFEQAAACFEKALVNRPRFAIALRDLAASYAMTGEKEKAAAVIQEVLKIEPQLTITKLRERTPFYAENWQGFTEGLRLAGLPE
jgi:tetratricopeptide (TPR) repeat protein